MSDVKLPNVKKPRAKKVQLPPSTSYLTEDKSYCLSCRIETPNASDTFKLERYKSNWGLTLRCADCGKNKHKFLSKGETSHLPEGLRNSEVGTIINKEDYESTLIEKSLDTPRPPLKIHCDSARLKYVFDRKWAGSRKLTATYAYVEHETLFQTAGALPIFISALSE